MQVQCNRCFMYVMIMVAIMIFCSILLNRYILFLNLRHTNCISRLCLLDALKYVAESKYLGFSFCDSKQDDNDILRQMRTVHAKSNTILRTFSHCSTDVKVTLFQSYCTALYCPFLWSDYKKSTFRKIRVAFNNAYRKIFGLPKRSSASAMYAEHNICNFETTIRKSIYGFMQRLENSTNSIICTLYNSCLIRFVIWNHWIESLYTA